MLRDALAPRKQDWSARDPRKLGMLRRSGTPGNPDLNLDLSSDLHSYFTSLVRAIAGWRPQDIVCPGASPGGSVMHCLRPIASRAAVPRRCVAVAPRCRGTAALHAILCVRTVQEPGGVSPPSFGSGSLIPRAPLTPPHACRFSELARKQSVMVPRTRRGLSG